MIKESNDKDKNENENKIFSNFNIIYVIVINNFFYE